MKVIFALRFITISCLIGTGVVRYDRDLFFSVSCFALAFGFTILTLNDIFRSAKGK